MTYCDYCRKKVDYYIKNSEEKYIVKGEEIIIEAHICVCKECNQDLWVPEIERQNLNTAYDEYRRRHGIVFPSQIRQLRERYGLSQTALARLLGFGDKTIARYEGGSIPDEAPNNLLILMNDDYNFGRLFEKNRAKLSEIEQKKVEEILKSPNKHSFGFYSAVSEYEFGKDERDLTFAIIKGGIAS